MLSVPLGLRLNPIWFTNPQGFPQATVENLFHKTFHNDWGKLQRVFPKIFHTPLFHSFWENFSTFPTEFSTKMRFSTKVFHTCGKVCGKVRQVFHINCGKLFGRDAYGPSPLGVPNFNYTTLYAFCQDFLRKFLKKFFLPKLCKIHKSKFVKDFSKKTFFIFLKKPLDKMVLLWYNRRDMLFSWAQILTTVVRAEKKAPPYSIS